MPDKYSRGPGSDLSESASSPSSFINIRFESHIDMEEHNMQRALCKVRIVVYANVRKIRMLNLERLPS